jgi:hypothetical protein
VPTTGAPASEGSSAAQRRSTAATSSSRTSSDVAPGCATPLQATMPPRARGMMVVNSGEASRGSAQYTLSTNGACT